MITLVFEKEDRVFGISHSIIEMALIVLYIAFFVIYGITKINIFLIIGRYFTAVNILYIVFYGISCNRVLINTDIFKDAIAHKYTKLISISNPTEMLKYHDDIQNDIVDTFYRILSKDTALVDTLRRIYLYMMSNSEDPNCTSDFLTLISFIVSKHRRQFRKSYEKFIFKEYQHYLSEYNGYKLEAYTKATTEYPYSLFELVCHCVITGRFFEDISKARERLFRISFIERIIGNSDIMNAKLIFDHMIAQKTFSIEEKDNAK